MTIVQNIQADAVETTHGFSNYGGEERPSVDSQASQKQPRSLVYPKILSTIVARIISAYRTIMDTHGVLSIWIARNCTE